MKIVFFDGYCSLCNGLVDWLLRTDKKQNLKFASLQGKTAAEMLDRHLAPADINTIIYLQDDKKFERSTAILMLLSDLGGVWSMTRLLLLIPKFIRDLVYRVVAANRYRFFGRKDSCRTPTTNERERLLP